jgi:hypothetical protein
MNGGSGAAGQAAAINMGLMRQLSSIGVPATAAGIDYAKRGIDAGLPSYVNGAFNSAGTAALEQSLGESAAARRSQFGGTNTLALGSRTGAFGGAAAALATERAGQAVAKAGATVSNRNQLLKTMLGGSADAVNISAGAGRLTNMGLEAGLGRGDAAYEGVTGGIAALAPIFLKAMTPSPGSNLAAIPSPVGNPNANMVPGWR